jgi:hypothetical protein
VTEPREQINTPWYAKQLSELGLVDEETTLAVLKGIKFLSSGQAKHAAEKMAKVFPAAQKIVQCAALASALTAGIVPPKEGPVQSLDEWGKKILERASQRRTADMKLLIETLARETNLGQQLRSAIQSHTRELVKKYGAVNTQFTLWEVLMLQRNILNGGDPQRVNVVGWETMAIVEEYGDDTSTHPLPEDRFPLEEAIRNDSDFREIAKLVGATEERVPFPRYDKGH